VERDISGFVGSVFRHLTEDIPLTFPDTPDIPSDGADLVISLNVLSQLPILPMEFAAQKNNLLGDTIPARLIAAHLEALAELPCRVCLITEIEQRLCLNGEAREKTDPLAGNEIPQTLKTQSTSWDWQYAPHPERHPRYDLVYNVEGFAK